MRVVVILVLVFLTGAEAIGRVIQCSPRLFCNDEALLDWKRTRDDAQKLTELRHSSLSFDQKNAKKNSSFYDLMDLRSRLCLDTSVTAFLLTNETMDETRLSCIWPGNELSLTCTPVPEKYTSGEFYYIPPAEVAQMIWVGDASGSGSVLRILFATAPPPPQTTDAYFNCTPRQSYFGRKEFRKKIHCPRIIEGVDQPRNQMTELYVCNERCTQAGIGYLASCLMMIAFSVSLIQNCFTAPA